MKKLTISELGDPLAEFTTPKQAREYFKGWVIYQQYITGQSRRRAEHVVRSNIGYYSGYFDSETSLRVRKLFNAPHPYFGWTIPTSEEAFNLGVEMGKKTLKRRKRKRRAT